MRMGSLQLEASDHVACLGPEPLHLYIDHWREIPLTKANLEALFYVISIIKFRYSGIVKWVAGIYF